MSRDDLKELVDGILAKAEEPMTERQQAILQAALDLFAEQGYAGTPTKQIAEAAGVAEGTIFKHFRNKRGLLLHLVLPTLIRIGLPGMIRDAERIVQDPELPLEEMVCKLLENRLQLVKDHFPQFKVLLVEALYDQDLYAIIQREVVQRLWPAVVGVCARMVERGAFRPLPPEVIVRTLVSLMGGYAMECTFIKNQPELLTDPQAISQIADVFLAAVKA